jgi:hypothetical protein
MSNIQMWNLVLAFLLPLVLAVIQQPSWSKTTRSFVAFLVSGVVALGNLYFNDVTIWDSSNIDTVIGSVLTVFVATIAFYRGFWRTTGDTAAESITGKIELKTSPGA